MADDVILDPGAGGSVIATDEVGGRHYQLFQPVFGDADSKTRVSAADPMPVAVGGVVAVSQSGAWSVAATISGTVAVTGPLTDVQLRATPVPVSGTFWQATQPVSLASVPSHEVQAAQAGAWSVSVSGNPACNLAQYGGSAVGAGNALHVQPGTGAAFPVTDNGGSLTVDGSVAATQSGSWSIALVGSILNPVDVAPAGGSFTVDDGGSTISVDDAGLSLTVDAVSWPLPTGASTEATLSTAATSLGVIDDWDSNDRAKVSPISGQDGVQGGAGAVTALTQRIAIATDANAVDTELPAAALLADGASVPTAPTVGMVEYTYNGSTLDLRRGCEEFVVLSSAARTATTVAGPFTNRNARGVMLTCQITTNASAVTLTIAVQVQDPVSGLWANISGTVSSVIGTTGVVTVHVVLPGCTAPTGLAGGNNVWAMPLPRSWRVQVTHSAGNSITYGIGGCYLP